MVKLPIYEEESSKEVKDSNGKKYLRIGSCNRCGVCCTTGNPFSDELGAGPVDGACFYFRWEIEPSDTRPGYGTCTGRHTWYWEAACRHWPSKPSHPKTFSNCSYVFEPVE